MRVVATTTMTQNSGVLRMRLKSMCVRGLTSPSVLLDQRTRRGPGGTRRLDDGTPAGPPSVLLNAAIADGVPTGPAGPLRRGRGQEYTCGASVPTTRRLRYFSA